MVGLEVPEIAPGTACPFCKTPMVEYGTAEVLGKYEARYARCASCGYIGVTNPHWLEESYADSSITKSDLGLLWRNQSVATYLDVAFRYWLKPKTIIDIGGGNGVLVRMLRDRGHQAFYADPYPNNLFAAGFEADPDASFSVSVAIEVIEHSLDPYVFLASMLQRAPVAIVGTELASVEPPALNEWWYFGLEHGQHIAFSTTASFQRAATRLGVSYQVWGGLHFFVSPEFRLPRAFRLLNHPKVVAVLAEATRGPSLLLSDSNR
jgi:hypothetical protein